MGGIKLYEDFFSKSALDTKKRLLVEFIKLGLALSLSLLLTELVTDVMKKWCGVQRPDFLSRCYTPKDQRSETEPWGVLPSR